MFRLWLTLARDAQVENVLKFEKLILLDHVITHYDFIMRLRSYRKYISQIPQIPKNWCSRSLGRLKSATRWRCCIYLTPYIKSRNKASNSHIWNEMRVSQIKKQIYAVVVVVQLVKDALATLHVIRLYNEGIRQNGRVYELYIRKLCRWKK
jgi:hypothetical protein